MRPLGRVLTYLRRYWPATLAAFVSLLLVTAAGTLLAVAVAALASPLMPIGPARVAEPHPGFSANWAVLGLGAIAVVVVVYARVAWPVWRLASAPAV